MYSEFWRAGPQRDRHRRPEVGRGSQLHFEAWREPAAYAGYPIGPRNGPNLSAKIACCAGEKTLPEAADLSLVEVSSLPALCVLRTIALHNIPDGRQVGIETKVGAQAKSIPCRSRSSRSSYRDTRTLTLVAP